LKTIIVLDEYCFYNEHDAFKPLCLTLDANYANPLVSSQKVATEHGVKLVDAPLLLDESYGLFGSFTDNVT
jgi:hypothetical protein